VNAIRSESDALAFMARQDLRDARYLIRGGHERVGALRIVTGLTFALASLYRLGGSS
jgi:hypothetical protein